MHPDYSHFNQEQSLAQWVAGQQKLFALQQSRLHDNCAELFGYFGLIESIDANNGLEQACRQQCLMQLATAWPPHYGGTEERATPLYADPHNLPFPDESIDLVVIHHLLEALDQPHQLVRQAARVVIPEGKLVVFGSNPFSLSGARHLLNHRARRSWRRHIPRAGRIRDWLELLGFTDFHISYQYPAIQRLQAESPSARMAQLSRNTPLPLRGSWCVMATKHKVARIMPNPLAGPRLSRMPAQVARRSSL